MVIGKHYPVQSLFLSLITFFPLNHKKADFMKPSPGDIILITENRWDTNGLGLLYAIPDSTAVILRLAGYAELVDPRLSGSEEYLKQVKKWVEEGIYVVQFLTIPRGYDNEPCYVGATTYLDSRCFRVIERKGGVEKAGED